MNAKQLKELKKLTGRNTMPFFQFENELSLAVKKHFSRRQKEGITVKEWLDSKIIAKLDYLAKNLPADGYSMGGIRKIIVNKYIQGLYNDCSEYANSCRYKAKHGFVSYKINFQELKNYSVIGGLITCIYPNQKSKVKKCFWLEGRGEKNNFRLLKIEGYICYNYHCVDKKNALAKGLENEKRDTERKKQAEKTAKNTKKALNCVYSFSDSLKAGNCEAGTRAFVLRCKLDINKKYRGKTLLKIASEKSTTSVPFVNRMLNFKASTL